MPGHAGNFLTRLFSLSPETMPHLSRHKLNESIVNKKLENFNRLDAYSFNQANDYVDWQKFHRGFTDFYDSNQIQLLNQLCLNAYTNVVYSIHPEEFIKFSNDIKQKDVDLYHVELDLNKFNNWVEQSQKKLKFITRSSESNNFLKIISTHPSKAISLTKMLESEESFLDEYIRVCALMKITPLKNQAIDLYQNWRSIRVDSTAKIADNSVVKIYSRAPSDDFTFLLFKSLLSSVSVDYEAYYIWSNPPDQLGHFIKNLNPTKPNIVIGIKDLLDMWKDYNWWADSCQEGTKLLIDLANNHPDKNFIIFTSLENLNLEIINVANIQVVPWGGDFVNQSDLYPTIEPVLDKNFNSDKTFISLNRNSRQHRLVLLSYLFGCGYDQQGHISYLGQCDPSVVQDDLLNIMPWEFDIERHAVAREKILLGYKQIYNNKSLIVDNYSIYKDAVNNNVGNFNQKLRHYYKNSFVEIITESSFTPPAYLLTEKVINSIYGCNFPILLSGVGAVAHLREIGVDVFDDIINHNYDTIANPLDRIIFAIEDNRRLLLDSEYAKQLWQENQHRFLRNVNFAKTKLYQWYQDRAIAQFNNIRWR